MASFFDGTDLQRSQCLYLAKLAEKGGRYDEVIYFMDRLVQSTQKIQLTHEEMNLLSVAHKQVVESLRIARRAFTGSGNDIHMSLFSTYMSGVDSQLKEQCNRNILLLKSLLNSPNLLETEEIADNDLLCSNPVRLELALNVSVFYYEVLGKFKEASMIAKETHEEAAKELKETLGKGPYEESSTIVLMKSLRDNLKAWEAQAPEEVHERS